VRSRHGESNATEWSLATLKATGEARGKEAIRTSERRNPAEIVEREHLSGLGGELERISVL
jgi:hypothetical protein